MWFTRYFNASTRKRCLSKREATGTPKFSRRLYNRGHTPPPQGAGVMGERVPRKHGHNGNWSPSMRRTPSPLRRVHADSGGAESASPATQRQFIHGRSSAPDLKRKISLEEITRGRSSSTGSHVYSIPPPIREDSISSALSTPEISTLHSPKFDRAFVPPSVPSLPRRSSTHESPTRRLSAYKMTSRVLVMPSVAMVSYSPEPVHNQELALPNNNTS